MLRLSVLKGPDAGKTQVFHAQRVTIGDDVRNDFALTDAMVSRFHGVFEVVDGDDYTYRDLGSLNGSYIRCGAESHTLHDRARPQSVALTGRSQVALGQTLLEVELGPANSQLDLPGPPRTEPDLSDTLLGEGSGMRESIVRRVNEAPEHLAQRISTSSGDRIQVLFRLARSLNALDQIEDIIDQVKDATFEMFPLANFFAIVVPPESGDGPMTPLYTALRDGRAGEDLVLSQSLLQEVVEQRESVLYVRDNQGTEQDLRKSIVMAQITACLAAPLMGQRKLMGVMQVDSRGRTGMFGNEDLDLFTVLSSSAAFAMERAALSRSIYEMFEAFVHASVAAIDARDPTTAGHSQRVADYTIMTAMAVNEVSSGDLEGSSFSDQELTELKYAALLHDFGKIGVREQVLQKAARLHPGVYNTLQQRIETARGSVRTRVMQKFHQRLVEDGRAPGPDDIAALDARIEREDAVLQRFAKAAASLMEPRPLTAEDEQVVRAMQEYRFQDCDGVQHPLVTEDEARDLMIRFGTLNDDERLHIESHAALSRDFLSRIPWNEELAQIPCIAGQHHEKLDGSGYPLGITASELSTQVRILTICDIFDALTAKDRPYKRARSAEQGVTILRREVEQGKLDGEIVELFAERVVPRVADTLLRSRE